MKKLMKKVSEVTKVARESKALVLSVVLLTVLSFSFAVATAHAATGINRQINFQGKLVDNNGLNVADGTYTVVFSLYSTSSGGSAIWTESDTVTTKAGIFQVALGATTSLPDNVVFNQDNLYLGIKVGSDAEMTPRIRFSAVPYALNSASLDGVVATQSATGFNLQGGTGSLSNVSFTTTGGALTFQPGVAEGLTIQSNGANGLTLDTGGGAAVNIGNNNATSLVFGNSGHNPTYTFSGTGLTTLGGALTINGATETIGNGSNATIQTSGTTSGLTLLSQGSGNIVLGQNAGNGNVLINPNAGGQAGLIINDQGSGDLFTASAGGTTKFTVNNNGLITLLNGETIDNTTDDTIAFGADGSSGTGRGAIRVPIKTTSGDPSSFGAVGDIYYNSADSLFRCYQGSGWQNCITAVNFQSTNASNTVTLTASEQSLLSGSITPSSTTGKIWINFTGTIVAAANSAVNVTIRIRRGACTSGTQVGVDQVVSPSGTGNGFTAAVNYVDTPGVTTSTTYNVCAFTSTGSPTVGGRGMTLYEPTGSAATSGLGSLTVQNTPNANAVTGVSSLDFGPNSNPTDQFTITDLTGGVAQVQLGSQVGLLNQAETATSAWNFSNGLGIGTSSLLGALDVRGNTGTTPVASLSGSTTFAGLTIDNSGTGDILTASAGGVPHFTIQHNGTIVDSNYTNNGGLLYSNSSGVFNQLADVTSGSCLTSGGVGSLPVWTPCSGIGSNYFQLNAGAVSPFSSTADLLVGGTATTSAKFGFLNVANGTPTASLSAGVAGGVFLTSTGTLSTTNRQTLSIGNAVSGNIAIDPNGTSPVIIGQSANPAAELDIRGTSATRPVSSISGQTNFAGLVVDQSGAGDIFTASRSGLARFTVTAAGSIKLGTSEGAINQCLTSNGAGVAVSWGTCGGGGSSQWQINGPVIAQGNTTEDLVLGGVSTASAKFAFIGNAGNATPVASISAQAGSTAPTGLALSPSQIQSLNNTTLTIGGNTTGNILFSPLNGAGSVQFFNNNNTINSSGNLTLAGNIALPNSNTLTGASGLLQLSNGIAFGGAATNNISSTGVANLASGTLTGTGNALTLSGAGANINFSGTGTAQILTANNQNLVLDPGGNGSVGINAASNLLASFDVRGIVGTTPTASVSGATTNANLVVDQSGLGDIFSASVSGASKFTILNNGNIQANNYTNNAGVLYTDNTGLLKQTATGSDQNCLVMSGTTPTWGSCVTGGGSDMTQNSSALNNTTLAATSTLIGTVNITPTTTTGDVWVQAETWTNSLSNTNQTITWELRSGSNCSGTLLTSETSALTSANSSDGPSGFLSYVTANPGTSTQTYAICGLSTTASGVSAGGLATATVIDNTGPQGPAGNTSWQVNGPVLSPSNNTMDLTIGGTSTASAKFAVLNMAGNTPTASLSAGIAGGAYMTATGTIQTTANQTLTLGGSTTGNIILNPNGGNYVGIGTQNPLASLDIRGSTGLGGGTTAVASISGKTSFAALIVNNSGPGDLFTASESGATKFTIKNNGSVVFTGNDVTISASGSGAVNNGSGSVENVLGDQGSLVPNAGFEAANSLGGFADGWVTSATSSATVARDTSVQAKGNGSAKITGNAGQFAAFYSACMPLALTTATGTAGPGAYDLAWYQRPNSTTILPTIRAYVDGYTSQLNCNQNKSASVSNPISTNLAASTNWALATGAQVAFTGSPANLTWGRVHFYIAFGTAASQVNIDGVRLIENSVTGGLDYAENYPADPNNVPQPGDVVSLEASSTASLVTKADISHQSILGVVSTKPGYVLNDGSMTNPVPVALAGRVPVNVSTANGAIHAGDYLTYSNTPGFAAKATSVGPVIGTAMTDFDCSLTDIQSFVSANACNGQVTMFIKNTWYDPTVSATTTGNYDLLKNADLSTFDASPSATGNSIVAAAYTIKDGAGIAVTSTTAFAKATIANIQAGAVVAKEMSTDSLTVTTGNITLGGQTLSDYIKGIVKQTLREVDQKGSSVVSVNGLVTATQSAQLVQSLLDQKGLSATVSGMTVTGVLGADTIDTKHIAGLVDLSASAITTATLSAQTITADTIKANHIEGLDIITTGLQKDDARITALENLAATQAATVAPTGIIASPTAGLATLTDNSFATTPSGDLRVKGNALVEGILHIAGTLFANDFIANGVADFFGNVIFHTGVTFQQTPTFNSDTAGIAVIKKGTDHVDVKFSKAYDQTPVINASITMVSLTPTPSETPDVLKQRQTALEKTLLAANIRYVVTNRTNNGFTILLEKPAEEDIAFSWLALSVQNSDIFQSQNQQNPSPTNGISPSPIDSIMPEESSASAGF